MKSNQIYRALIELIEKGSHNEVIVLNYLMLKSIKGENTVVNKKTGSEITQGKYQISRRELSKKTKLSERTIRTVILSLSNKKLIRYTVVDRVYVFDSQKNAPDQTGGQSAGENHDEDGAVLPDGRRAIEKCLMGDRFSGRDAESETSAHHPA